MPCRDIVDSTVSRLSGELPGELESELDRHLATCERCREEARRVEEAWGILGEAPEPVPSRRFVRETLAKLEKATLDRKVWSLAPRATWRSRAVLLQAAALVLAALGGFAVARRSASPTAPADAGLLGSAAEPSGVVRFASARTLDVAKARPDLSTQPRLANVSFAPPDATGRVGVAFDVTTRYTVLGRPEDPGLAEVLTYLLSKPASTEGARGKAIELVAQGLAPNAAASPQVVEALVQTLKSDRNPGVRKKAAEALAQMPPAPEIRDALVAALKADSNPAIRAAAVDGLARMARERKDPASIEMLRERATDEKEAGFLRVRAATALKAI